MSKAHANPPAGRSLMGGTEAGKARKRKADHTRGLRERAWAAEVKRRGANGGSLDPVDIRDAIYLRNPDLLDPASRALAEASTGKAAAKR